jgi:hypothetical protein
MLLLLSYVMQEPSKPKVRHANRRSGAQVRSLQSQVLTNDVGVLIELGHQMSKHLRFAAKIVSISTLSAPIGW